MSAGAESPVATALAKRVRALKKKLGKAEQLEQAVKEGKPINEDQEEVIKSKPGCAAAIDELSKLDALLREAVAEEVKMAKVAWEAAAAKKAEKEEAKRVAAESAKQQQAEEKEKEKGEQLEIQQKAAALSLDDKDKITQELIEQLLPLLYFSRMFEKNSSQALSAQPEKNEAAIIQLTQVERVREAERFACRSWVSQGSNTELTEMDMEFIVQFGKLMSCRPASQLISHEDAIQQCCAIAKRFLSSSAEPVPELVMPGQNPPTCGYLAEQVNKIKGSKYFTVKPVTSMVQPQEMQASPGAAEDAPAPAPETPGLEAAPVVADKRSPPEGPPPPAEDQVARGMPPQGVPPGLSGSAAAPGVQPYSPEQWSYGPIPSMPPSTGSAGPVMDGSQAHLTSLPIGQAPVSHGAPADMMSGQQHHFPQGGMQIPMGFNHGGFMMPQHAGAMPHMMPPGAYEHMYQGMPYMMPPGAKVDGPPGSQLMDPKMMPPGMGPKDGHPGGPADGSGPQGGRQNSRQHGGGSNRGRNRGRGDGGRGGGGNRGRGEGRGRGNAQGPPQGPPQGRQPAPPSQPQNGPPVV